LNYRVHFDAWIERKKEKHWYQKITHTTTRFHPVVLTCDIGSISTFIPSASMHSHGNAYNTLISVAPLVYYHHSPSMVYSNRHRQRLIGYGRERERKKKELLTLRGGIPVAGQEPDDLRVRQVRVQIHHQQSVRMHFQEERLGLRE
jgi:hypothetical protein